MHTKKNKEKKNKQNMVEIKPQKRIQFTEVSLCLLCNLKYNLL